MSYIACHNYSGYYNSCHVQRCILGVIIVAGQKAAIDPMCCSCDSEVFKTGVARISYATTFPLQHASIQILQYLANYLRLHICQRWDPDDTGRIVESKAHETAVSFGRRDNVSQEPFVENSGHVQGRIFYRQRVSRDKKDIIGPNVLTWKDLKIGEDVVMFGRSYRVVSCDTFTKNFLQDRGVVVQDSEEMIPVDAWNMTRHFGPRFYAEAHQLQKLHINEDADLRSWTPMPTTMSFHVAWLDTKTTSTVVV
uniref:DM10 domain-containing protein n=1 Tax=Ditylenchus dipsaci TaxID=166011 RepID=A0A915E7Q8_9BILA